MAMHTRSTKRRPEEEDRLADRISSLPDGVLGDIICLLPAKDGARTQLLSSRWRHLWSCAPLNIEVRYSTVSCIISSHPGPGRCFNFSYGYDKNTGPAKELDAWLRCPGLGKLQELQLHHVLPVPESAFRFSSTLRVAKFHRCTFSDGNNASALHFPLLKQLSLQDISISESYLHSLLAACPALQSLLLCWNYYGFPRVQIVSPSLISIGVDDRGSRNFDEVQQLVIKDAPYLERLLFLGYEGGTKIDVLVISAPRLLVLGKHQDNNFPRFHSGNTTTMQGFNIASMTAVVSSVKVLALSNVKPCLNVVINIMKCFPRLEKLCIKLTRLDVDNQSRCEENIISQDMHLREIVLATYEGYKSQIKLAKFFISNARVLKLMRFECRFFKSSKWIEMQHSLLEIEKRASMDAQFDFVCEDITVSSCQDEEVHDLSILDPFQRRY